MTTKLYINFRLRWWAYPIVPLLSALVDWLWKKAIKIDKKS